MIGKAMPTTSVRFRDGGCEPADGCTYTVSLRGVLGIADYGFARLGSRCVYVRLPLWFWSVACRIRKTIFPLLGFPVYLLTDLIDKL